MGSTKQVRRLNQRLAAQIDLLDQSEPRREEIHQKMLRLPEGKAPKVYCKPKLVPLAPSRTLQLVTMDMAGPLPITKEGHRYILVMCDHFTKHIKVFPMKTQTALEVAEKCMDYCLTFGIPESVLTDQGSNFTSQVIESLWERLDVHTLRTTAYHPQTDGITERFNRTIKTMLTQFVHEQKQDN